MAENPCPDGDPFPRSRQPVEDVEIAGSPVDFAFGVPVGEVAVLAREALAELAAMPADAAHAILEEARRQLAPAAVPAHAPAHPLRGELVGTATVRANLTVGVRQDAVFLPANAATLRRLFALPSVSEIRALVFAALLDAASPCGCPHYGAQPDGFGLPRIEAVTRAPAPSEREPTPAPPLPSLLGPEDVTQAGRQGDDDDQGGGAERQQSGRGDDVEGGVALTAGATVTP
jgi:hypothetical protein